MDQRTTLCEHAGRLIEQTSQTEHTTRQYLSQHDIRIPALFNVPPDEQVASERNVDAKRQVNNVKRDHWLVWKLLQYPIDLSLRHLWGSTVMHVDQSSSQHIALCPVASIAAIASSRGTLSFHDTDRNRLWSSRVSFPGLAQVTSLAWHASSLAVTYAEGQVAILELDLSSQQVKRSQLLPLLPLSTQLGVCHQVAWLDVRFIIVASSCGLFLVDTTKQDPAQASLRIFRYPCTSLSISASFIAVGGPYGVHTMSYRYPMQVSQTVRCTKAPPTSLVFAQERVLLYASADAPEVKAVQLAAHEEFKAPSVRALEKLVLSHLGQVAITHVVLSGSRVMMSTGAWTGLAQLTVEPNRAFWQEIGQVFGPNEDEGDEHGGRAALLEAVPIRHGRAKEDGSRGFACLWSTSQASILPII
ncbi:hypothetical protein BCR37DRAFT_384136 [Protomyces lactucae-debilis]|uniref:Uncharacterized protein n=1 Tax=Protomyces lactucae-debilis TaxID=2754530 RepID=A0A1Y2EUY9_PROLT|nr:uncharacterized protein BCR37DRAFT_384136 [Protomyces lactucae-debilis]ORY75084.1 hypothetical protein BCR37DRAFT_384136 [Protomyces lactucae-debilis]